MLLLLLLLMLVLLCGSCCSRCLESLAVVCVFGRVGCCCGGGGGCCCVCSRRCFGCLYLCVWLLRFGLILFTLDSLVLFDGLE